MGFSDDQMKEAIKNNLIVSDTYNKIKDACQALKKETACPDEDVDSFLKYLIGKWQ